MIQHIAVSAFVVDVVEGFPEFFNYRVIGSDPLFAALGSIFHVGDEMIDCALGKIRENNPQRFGTCGDLGVVLDYALVADPACLEY